jgi:hypothetical protein
MYITTGVYHEVNIGGGGKTFMSSLNICPEAGERGVGGRSNAPPPPVNIYQKTM